MKVRFLTLAQQELDDAVAWYNEQAAGLGYDFLYEVDRAAAVIFAHNHPSGDLQPSEADRRIHDQLTEAGKILGIRVPPEVHRNLAIQASEAGVSLNRIAGSKLSR